MVKVWNITDAAGKGQNRMVLGKTVRPGRSVNVDEARLAKAHKVQRDVDAGILSVGPRPPAWYLAKKKPPKAKADARRIGPDGRLENPTEAPKEVRKGHAVSAPTKAKAPEVKPIRTQADEPGSPEEAEKLEKDEKPEKDEKTEGRRKKKR